MLEESELGVGSSGHAEAQRQLRCEVKYQCWSVTLDDFVALWVSIFEGWMGEVQHVLQQIALPASNCSAAWGPDGPNDTFEAVRGCGSRAGKDVQVGAHARVAVGGGLHRRLRQEVKAWMRVYGVGMCSLQSSPIMPGDAPMGCSPRDQHRNVQPHPKERQPTPTPTKCSCMPPTSHSNHFNGGTRRWLPVLRQLSQGRNGTWWQYLFWQA